MAASTVSLGILITATVGAAHGALQSFGKNIERLRESANRASIVYGKLGEKIKSGIGKDSEVRRLSDAYGKLGRTIEQARGQADKLALAQEKIAGHRAALGQLKGQVLGVFGLGMTLAAPVKQAMAFESAMADVRKVVDFETPGGFKRLGDTLLEMSRRIPLAATQLAAITASGGQLGVAERDLETFTETIAKMSVAFDMTAEEAGDSMAKLANVYQIPIMQLGDIGDTINELSNNSPAKARDIVNTLGRIGGVARQFGYTERQAASLANAFISLGKAPEVAGTAINAMMTRMMTADTDKGMSAALEALGTSAADLKKAISEDAEGAMMHLLQLLAKVPKEERTGYLVKMFGRNFADDAAVLVGSLDTYSKSIDIVNGKTKGSMDKEFAARAATTANSFQLLKNNVSELAINLGTALLPPLNSVLSDMRPFVETLAEWAKRNPETVASIGKLVAGLLLFKTGSLAARASFHVFSMLGLGFINRLKGVRAAWTMASLVMQSRSLLPIVGQAGRASAALGGLRKWMASVAISSNLLSRNMPKMTAVTEISKMGTRFFKIGVAGRTAFSALAGGARAFGLALLTTPVGWFTVAIAGLALLFWKFRKQIFSFVSGAWAGFKSGLAPIVETLRPAVGDLITAFGNLMSALSPLKPVLEVIFWPVLTPLRLVYSGIKSLLAPVNETSDAARSIGEAFGKGVAVALQWLGKLVAGLFALPTKVFQAGADIVNGLIDGIKGKWTGTEQVVVGMADGIADEFQDQLQIESPSRVFMGFGGFIGKGAELGIIKGIPGVRGAAGKLAGAALAGALAMPSPALAFDAPGGALPAAAIVSSGAARQTAASAGAMTVNFSPTINVTGGKDADVKGQVQQAMSLSMHELERMLRRIEAERERRVLQ